MRAAAAMVLLAVSASAVRSASASAEESQAGPSATLAAAFRPTRLGAATTVSFAVSIDPPPGAQPLPLAQVEVSYPADLGLGTSGLGLQECDPAALEIEGAGACPPDSKMGQGNALIEVPFGPDIVKEHVALGIYAAPSNDGYVHLAISAYGTEPVIAQIVIAGVLLPGQLKLNIPPVATLPGAPYASLVKMHAILGGALTYYEHVHGRTIPYRPRGIGLPDSCPHGGWKVGANFAFIGGQSSHAGTVIPCPGRQRAQAH